MLGLMFVQSGIASAFPTNMRAAPHSLWSLTNPAATQESSDKADTCANFSGKWRGTCTTQDQNGASSSYTDEMTIEQKDCDELTSNDQTLQIGGTHEESNTGPKAYDHYTLAMDWNSDKSGLVLDMSLTGRGFQNSRTAYRYQGTGHGQFDLGSDGKLTTSFKSTVQTTMAGTQDQPQTFSSVDRCVYERQAP